MNKQIQTPFPTPSDCGPIEHNNFTEMVSYIEVGRSFMCALVKFTEFMSTIMNELMDDIESGDDIDCPLLDSDQSFIGYCLDRFKYNFSKDEMNEQGGYAITQTLFEQLLICMVNEFNVEREIALDEERDAIKKREIETALHTLAQYDLDAAEAKRKAKHVRKALKAKGIKVPKKGKKMKSKLLAQPEPRGAFNPQLMDDDPIHRIIDGDEENIPPLKKRKGKKHIVITKKKKEKDIRSDVVTASTK